MALKVTTLEATDGHPLGRSPGRGKTTTAAKLAAWFKQQGASLPDRATPTTAASNNFASSVPRSASTSLRTSKPIDVARHGLKEATRLGRDVVIIDTAGRLSIDEALMDEVRSISKSPCRTTRSW